jgi:hypothetical protein
MEMLEHQMWGGTSTPEAAFRLSLRKTGVCMNCIKRGQIFGEYAALSGLFMSAGRTATAMSAVDETALLMIPSVAYNEIVGTQEKVIKKEKMKAIQVSCLAHILTTEFHQDLMCRVLETRKFSPGMIVIGRRDLNTSMMLLARGQVGGKDEGDHTQFVYGPGDLLSGQLVPGNAFAMTPVLAYSFNPSEVSRLHLSREQSELFQMILKRPLAVEKRALESRTLPELQDLSSHHQDVETVSLRNRPSRLFPPHSAMTCEFGAEGGQRSLTNNHSPANRLFPPQPMARSKPNPMRWRQEARQEVREEHGRVLARALAAKGEAGGAIEAGAVLRSTTKLPSVPPREREGSLVKAKLVAGEWLLADGHVSRTACPEVQLGRRPLSLYEQKRKRRGKHAPVCHRNLDNPGRGSRARPITASLLTRAQREAKAMETPWSHKSTSKSIGKIITILPPLYTRASAAATHDQRSQHGKRGKRKQARQRDRADQERPWEMQRDRGNGEQPNMSFSPSTSKLAVQVVGFDVPIPRMSRSARRSIVEWSSAQMTFDEEAEVERLRSFPVVVSHAARPPDLLLSDPV